MSKKDIMDEENESSYNPFMVNRTLSYFPDTVLLANEMNLSPDLPKRLQFQFFISTVRRRKRFSKWGKVSTDRDLEVVKEYYDYSDIKARETLRLLSEDQISLLRERTSKGGKRK